MDDLPKSTTEEEVWAEESMFGLGGHYKCTIVTETGRVVEGRGNTPEEAEANAHEAYERWKANPY